MKEWICVESPNEVEGGMLVREQELIRCKDCYFYDTFQRKHYCTKYDHSVKQNGYCAWAEPKEDA